jgi:hypothetical protein
VAFAVGVGADVILERLRKAHVDAVDRDRRCSLSLAGKG